MIEVTNEERDKLVSYVKNYLDTLVAELLIGFETREQLAATVHDTCYKITDTLLREIK